MATVLVTGASSGIGRAAAEEFARAGQEVLGLARRADRVPSGVTPVAVDLADPQALDRAFAGAPLAGRRIDVLVHCAGYGDFAPVELTPLADARRQLEVGVLAAMGLAQHVLPAMRAAGAGRIVLVSSIAADLASPMGGWYHAGKAALESVADTLRQEVAGFGVEVSLIRPGMVRTAWHDSALDALTQRVAGTPYDVMGRATAAYHRRAAESAQAIEVAPVVAAIRRAAQDPRPRTRYLVGRGARVATLLPRIVPDRIFDGLTRRQFGIA